MRMKIDFHRKIDLKLLLYWLLLGTLLAVTLSLPSTRESQTLCLRWLLHWNAHTTVQGRFDGYGGGFCIPKVQFTPEYEQVLRERSTNSLEDFFLATPTEYKRAGFCPNLPPVESAWTNSPLLPSMTFLMAVRSTVTNSAHALSPEYLNSVRTMMRLARMTDPANGAYSQAEACFDFAVHDNQAALQALWTSCSNRNWTICLAATFSGYSSLFQRAGLSKLDAAVQAVRMAPFENSYFPQHNQKYLDGLMIQAVSDGKPQEFVKLLQLLVELRRADWSDKYPDIYNVYRRFRPSDRLVEAMAVPLEMNLATNWADLPYDQANHVDQVKAIRQRVFQGYLNRYADPVTVTVFNTQSESYQTESHLKNQIWELGSQSGSSFAIGSQVAGGSSLLLLSLLCSALMFNVIYWRLKRRAGQGRRWWCDPLFWILFLGAIFLNTVIFSSFLNLLKLADISAPAKVIEIAKLFDIHPPGISAPGIACFFFLFFSAGLAYRLRQWKRGRLQNSSWKAVRLFAVAYLVAILAMAFFRSQLVACAAAQYQ
jgi:hypothetical protein